MGDPLVVFNERIDWEALRKSNAIVEPIDVALMFKRRLSG
jgi:hypothetical protein